MKLVCPSCKADIPASEANLERALARCRRCNEVIGFADQIAHSRPTSLAGRALPREAVPLPKGFVVDELSGRFRLTQRWFSAKAFFFLFFSVFWNGIVGVFVVAVLAGAFPKPVLAFLSIHIAVGLGIAWYTLCSFFNHTTVSVSDDQLLVRHGPLPWPGNRAVLLSDLQQLFSREKVSQTKNGTSVTYELHAALRSGGVIKLLSGLDAPEQALFVEQQLESRLGIRDEPVAGELAR